MSAKLRSGSPERSDPAASRSPHPRKKPLLVGYRRAGCVTIWFLERASLPDAGPWDVAMVTRRA